MSVFWPQMNETFRGEVRDTYSKDGVDGVIVLYDGREYWHDFGQCDGGCTFTVLEPPLWKLAKIRRTNDDRFEGTLPSPNHGRVYRLTTRGEAATRSDASLWATLSVLRWLAC